MKKVLILHIIFVLLICFNCNAQEIYGIVPPGGTTTHKVYRYNPNNTLSFAFEFVAAIGCTDIAISPSGTFYGVGNPGIIYEIDTVNGSITELAQPLFPQISNSLVCSNDYKLYALNGSGILTTYNILTNTSEFVFDLADAPTGDLTFYKGNLIFQSFTSGNIKAFNLEDENLVNIFCGIVNEIDTTFVSFWGNSNIFENCSTETIIAFERSADIYELDLGNQLAINLNVDNSVLSTPCFMGSASSTEHLSSACNSVKLANVDCTVSKNEVNTNSNIYLYPNPVNDILYLKTTSQIDFVEIYNIQGVMIDRIVSPGFQIEMRRFEKGIYFLKIKSNSGIQIKKLIKESY